MLFLLLIDACVVFGCLDWFVMAQTELGEIVFVDVSTSDGDLDQEGKSIFDCQLN